MIPENRTNTENTRLTLHVVTNEDGFSNGGEIGEKRYVVSNFYLGGLINDNSVKTSFSEDTLYSQCVTGQHAECTKYNWAAIEFREPPRKFTTGDDIGSDGGI